MGHSFYFHSYTFIMTTFYDETTDAPAMFNQNEEEQQNDFLNEEEEQQEEEEEEDVESSLHVEGEDDDNPYVFTFRQPLQTTKIFVSVEGAPAMDTNPNDFQPMSTILQDGYHWDKLEVDSEEKASRLASTRWYVSLLKLAQIEKTEVKTSYFNIRSRRVDGHHRPMTEEWVSTLHYCCPIPKDIYNLIPQLTRQGGWYGYIDNICVPYDPETEFNALPQKKMELRRNFEEKLRTVRNLLAKRNTNTNNNNARTTTTTISSFSNINLSGGGNVAKQQPAQPAENLWKELNALYPSDNLGGQIYIRDREPSERLVYVDANGRSCMMTEEDLQNSYQTGIPVMTSQDGSVKSYDSQHVPVVYEEVEDEQSEMPSSCLLFSEATAYDKWVANDDYQREEDDEQELQENEDEDDDDEGEERDPVYLQEQEQEQEDVEEQEEEEQADDEEEGMSSVMREAVEGFVDETGSQEFFEPEEQPLELEEQGDEFEESVESQHIEMASSEENSQIGHIVDLQGEYPEFVEEDEDLGEEEQSQENEFIEEEEQ